MKAWCPFGLYTPWAPSMGSTVCWVLMDDAGVQDIPLEAAWPG